MSQSVAFFDIAGTIVAGNPWNYFLRHSDVSSSRIRSAKLRFLPVYFGAKLRLIDDVAFRHRYMTGMARVLRGWTHQQVLAVCDWVVNDQMDDLLNDDVLAHLQQHKQNGDCVVLVSGMLDVMGQAFADRVGADAWLGSKLAFENGVCTGLVDGPTLMGPRKLTAIRCYLEENGLPVELAACYGYADSYSDVPLLSSVGHSVAVHPEAALRKVAEAHGWEIIET